MPSSCPIPISVGKYRTIAIISVTLLWNGTKYMCPKRDRTSESLKPVPKSTTRISSAILHSSLFSCLSDSSSWLFRHICVCDIHAFISANSPDLQYSTRLGRSTTRNGPTTSRVSIYIRTGISPDFPAPLSYLYSIHEGTTPSCDPLQPRASRYGCRCSEGSIHVRSRSSSQVLRNSLACGYSLVYVTPLSSTTYLP